MSGNLCYGSNLQVLRDEIGSETVNLVYLDPPADPAWMPAFAGTTTFLPAIRLRARHSPSSFPFAPVIPAQAGLQPGASTRSGLDAGFAGMTTGATD